MGIACVLERPGRFGEWPHHADQLGGRSVAEVIIGPVVVAVMDGNTTIHSGLWVDGMQIVQFFNGGHGG